MAVQVTTAGAGAYSGGPITGRTAYYAPATGVGGIKR